MLDSTVVVARAAEVAGAGMLTNSTDLMPGPASAFATPDANRPLMNGGTAMGISGAPASRRRTERRDAGRNSAMFSILETVDSRDDGAAPLMRTPHPTARM